MRTLMQPVSVQFVNCVFFTNLLEIFNGSQTSDYFDVRAPTLTEYLWEVRDYLIDAGF